MPLSPGDKLGHFEIVSLLGEGGMGVVYKARDPRLDRLVAIKLLTESRISDPDRRARFMQEARAASALNHPGIVTIHDIAEQDGRHYIVMEFVDGKPLNERIPRKGMGLTEGLRLAVQIADALAAAHAAGIVHRDIKPANIMVDSQGRTKVLDFGLAKLSSPTIEAGDETRTIAMDGPRTEEGAIVGSVPYMSPEQVEGRLLDARSDIFSFGAVLYEMFTGQRAFRGDSRISTLAAVVQTDPPPAGEVAPGVPTELERVISRCLRKEVTRRSQNMSDIKLALEELRDESESGKLLRTASGVSAAAPARRRWLWLAITAVCVLIAAIMGWILLRHETAAPVSANMVRVSPDDGYSYHDPAISADCKFVAFISDRSGTDQLWLRQVGGGDAVQLTHSANRVTRAEFFPDGTRLLIATLSEQPGKNTYEIVSMLGGQSRVLLTGEMAADEKLSPDGRQVSYIDMGAHPEIKIIQVDPGTTRVLEKFRRTQPSVGYMWQHLWMPNGRALIVTGTGHPDSPSFEIDRDWFTLPVNGGDPVRMGAGAALRAAGVGNSILDLGAIAGDRIVFATGPGEDRTNVWQIRFNPESGRVAGPPRQLTFGTEQETPSSVCAAGTVAIESSRPSSDFFMLPIDPTTGLASGPARRLTQDGRYKTIPYLPGGGGDPGMLYFGVSRRTGHGFADDEVVLDLATPTSPQRLLNTEQETTAEWQTVSLDGRQIAYSRPEGDSFSISIGDAGSPRETARNLCSKCGRAVGFSPGAQYLATVPEYTGQPNLKYSVSLRELASGNATPWLEDPTESLVYKGLIAGKWVIIEAGLPGATSFRYYLAQWRPTPIPRSEWVEFHPPSGFVFSPTAPLIYGFQGSQLVGMRFDEKKMSFGDPFPVRTPPGSAAEIRPKDDLNVRAPGIVFMRRETNASVWLMKLPPE